MENYTDQLKPKEISKYLLEKFQNKIKHPSQIDIKQEIKKLENFDSYQ